MTGNQTVVLVLVGSVVVDLAEKKKNRNVLLVLVEVEVDLVEEKRHHQ
jgi:hypothetical protein